MAISRLRGKITPAGYGISSVRGSGYVFQEDALSLDLKPQNRPHQG